MAAVFAACSYLTLTCFDYFGIRYAGKRLPYPRVAFASFVSLGIGHTLGLAPFSSGAVRYRFYSRWGLNLTEIALMIVFCGLTVAAGEISVVAIGLLMDPELGARILKITPSLALTLGLTCVAVVLSYLIFCLLRQDKFRFRKWSIPAVPWRLALAQIVVGTMNYLFVVAALNQTLAAPIPYSTVATAYVLANVAALMSHVPGGLGVIEAVLVALLPGADVIGGVIAFRAIYFFVPFVLGSALFAGTELRLWIKGRQQLETNFRHR